jgi:hypothetical protein
MLAGTLDAALSRFTELRVTRVFSRLMLFSFGLVGAVAAAEPAPRVDFVRDIRPIFQNRCWSCHGEQKVESGLRLHRSDKLHLGGDLGKVVVPGKSQESRLWKYVSGQDPDHLMPPEGDPLTPAQVDLIRNWIDQGCLWPADADASSGPNRHWAYQPIASAPPPVLKDAAWPINEIDHFVLQGLEHRGVTPSPAADRYTLIRRLSLDLTGLLPTVEEVDAFVNDSSPKAYENLVDRLLQSPHFGERWGRHWLDMARYADSDGYEKDNPRPDAYRWRNWVIDAINADMPFDQFTIEQLAGDLLPNATPMQRLATAFHRQTLTNTEGGTDQEQFRVEACFDRTETTGAVWLGLTVGCARCHSHKYDAISQREYYQLFSFFNNGDEQTTVVPKSQAEVDAYTVAKAEHDREDVELLDALRRLQSEHRVALDAWIDDAQQRLANAAANPLKLHSLIEPLYTSDGGVTFETQPDGSVLVTGANPARARYTMTGRVDAASLTGLRLDVLPDDKLPAKGPGRVAHGNFVLSEVRVEVASKPDFSDARPVEIAAGRADFEQADKPWAAKNVFDDKNDTGWAIAPQYGKEHWLVLRFQDALGESEASYVRVHLDQEYGQEHTIGKFRLSLQTGIDPDDKLPEAISKVLAVAQEKRTETQQNELLEYASGKVPATRKAADALARHRKAQPAPPELTVRVLMQRRENPRQTFVLKRGEFLDPLIDSQVEAAGLSTLPALPPRTSGQPAYRLDLARWLVSRDNPLTPRVAVNQVWRLLFGEGLVRTASDFGVRGDLPTHPALLDWLAADFIGLPGTTNTTPWSRKALIRKIVLSATYRQSSHHRPELAETDPGNLWLARQNRLRVEGEIIRDISLQASGLLSPKVGGPSVFPPLPPGIAELSYAGNFKWTESKGPDRYRRGMYTFFKRTAPHPNLTTFDCPDANLACIERQSSNTPLQALVTLNNESFTESARQFAIRALNWETSDEDRLARAFRICVARHPRSLEQQELGRLLADSTDWYRSHAAEAGALIGNEAHLKVSKERQAAWTAVCRILLNLDEFITRE